MPPPSHHANPKTSPPERFFMKSIVSVCAWVCCCLILLPGMAAYANDVDGPNDCQRSTMDRGDAPEGFFAYPGVVGHFPTCLAPTLPGTRDTVCTGVSTIPGPTGYV